MQRPYDAETVQKALKQRISRSNQVLPPKGICGAIVGSLNKACGGKPDRDKMLFHLFDVTTSKELLPEQWVALLEWVGVYKNEHDSPPAWKYSEYLDAECKAILDSVRYNGMGEREKMEELRTRTLAMATQYKSPMTQLPPQSAEDQIEEIGY